jgi:hypothetical protein
MATDRALVISKQWAAVFASLFVALVVGCVSYAWTANAQAAVMQSDVAELKKAELSTRLARMEEKLDWLVRTQQKK